MSVLLKMRQHLLKFISGENCDITNVLYINDNFNQKQFYPRFNKQNKFLKLILLVKSNFQALSLFWIGMTKHRIVRVGCKYWTVCLYNINFQALLYLKLNSIWLFNKRLEINIIKTLFNICARPWLSCV